MKMGLDHVLDPKVDGGKWYEAKRRNIQVHKELPL
jgi:hypothetical protein